VLSDLAVAGKRATVVAPLDPHAPPADIKVQPDSVRTWAGEDLRELAVLLTVAAVGVAQADVASLPPPVAQGL